MQFERFSIDLKFINFEFNVSITNYSSNGNDSFVEPRIKNQPNEWEMNEDYCIQCYGCSIFAFLKMISVEYLLLGITNIYKLGWKHSSEEL